MDRLFEHVELGTFISIAYLSLAFSIAFTSVFDLTYGLINISRFLAKLFHYGKTTCNEITHLNVLQVPKRYFAHFYVVGTFASFVVLVVACREYETCPTTRISLAVITLHIIRRLYESYFVTVFSNSKMSIAHYMLGMFFYFTMPFCIFWSDYHAVAHGPLSTLTYLILNSIAQTVQHLSSRQLAALRKAPSKVAASNRRVLQYSAPRGSMFTYVTCPHFTAEIAIYSLTYAFLLGLAAPTPFSTILLFVWTNQVCAALIQHRWYEQHFPKFASTRTALFPRLF